MEAVERFRKLFRGRETCHGRYYPPKIQGGKKRVVTRKEGPTDQAWEDHLQGKPPFLGISPIRTDNTCYFGAIDLDDDHVDHAELERRVGALDLPLVVVRSKSGGAHLYLFLVNPAPASLVIGKLRAWAVALKLSNPADDQGRVPTLEVFPKQAKLKPEDVGNWINLPYFDAADTNRYAVIDGKPATLEEFLAYAEERAVTVSGLEASEANLSAEDTAFFKDGPPCLQALHARGFGEGERNQGLYNVGIYLKLKHPDDWEDRLQEYNDEKMDPPLPEDEVEQIRRSLDKKDYVFKCSDLPIVDFCKKSACKKQRFGIDAFRQREVESHLPDLTDLEKIMTDPPHWSLKINGTRVNLGTEDLMSLNRFRKVALERTNLVIPLIKTHDWDKVLRGLMENVRIVEAPDDAGTFGQFRVHVLQFIELRDKSDKREDLLLGKPYEEEEKVYFRSQDLLSFLERRRFREYTRMSDVYGALRMMGAGHAQFNLKGTCVQCWWLPSPVLEVNEDLEVPSVNGDREF